MHQSLDLSSNTVIQTSSVVDVNETISDPFTRGNFVVDLVKQIERPFDSGFCIDLSHGNGLRNLLSVVTQDVSRFLCSEQHHVAAVTPVNILGNSFDFLDKFTRVPLVEKHTVRSLYSDRGTAEEAIRTGRCRNDCLTLLEILVGFDGVRRLTDAVVSGSAAGPNEIEGLSECLVSQGLCCVDDEFSVSAYGYETTVAIVLQHLRVKLAGTEITGNYGEAFSIGNGIFAGSDDTLHTRGLDIIVRRPYDLSGRIHRSDGIIRTQLDANTALIESDRELVGLRRCGKRPGTFHPVI
mmetsp:Transcript_24990/g.53231  ORF Transcript_24990/g.53231 Transcript_24990/m.53231 type:complete len:295 (-) Transcript_24990:890-1774(-)